MDGFAGKLRPLAHVQESSAPKELPSGRLSWYNTMHEEVTAVLPHWCLLLLCAAELAARVSGVALDNSILASTRPNWRCKGDIGDSEGKVKSTL